MSEVRLVVAILVPAIFTLILKDFFDLFMTNRYEGKVKQYTIWMLYFLLDTVISMNFKFVGVISMLYSFIILIAFCAVLYRDDIKYITLTVLFIICIGAVSELIVALGIRAFLNSSQLQQFSLFGSTCSKLIILIIVRIVKLFRVSGIKRLDYMNWLANVSMTAGSLYIVYNLYLLSLNETKLLGSTMSSIIILLLNVICFKMFDKIAADAEIKRKNDIYKQSIDIYKREMEEREEHNEKLRRFRHDIKNHLIAIEKLALSKEYVRLRDYIHQLTDEKGVLQVTTMDVLDADISINDEATANVAPENEADLMNAVEELTKEKTIIMIAHRLKTVRKADQILVIEKGRIAEQGTHDVLLQKNGIYSSFICSRKEAVSWKVQKHS